MSQEVSVSFRLPARCLGVGAVMTTGAGRWVPSILACTLSSNPLNLNTLCYAEGIGQKRDYFGVLPAVLLNGLLA